MRPLQKQLLVFKGKPHICSQGMCLERRQVCMQALCRGALDVSCTVERHKTTGEGSSILLLTHNMDYKA